MSEKPSLSQQAQGSFIAQATDSSTATVQVVLPPTPRQEQNRVRFLKRLRALYEDMWEKSLQGAAQLTLGLTKKPDVVLYHTELLLRAPQQPQRPLPEGTTLLEVYDEAGQDLLLLGEPGAGKSTLLLELARRLVERAEQDPGHPLPVLLPLSSWAVKQMPLIEWLPAQLSLIYDVSRRLSRTWVQTDQIIPLLDGLDEVPQQTRVACIEAINTYRKEHLTPLVACSRRAEYEQLALQERLTVHSAVLIEPLTKQQVETYLEQAGPLLAAVRTSLQMNPVLQELATTPLMLSVLALAYTGAAEQDLPQRGTVAEQQQQIFTSYVERMVMRKGDLDHYPLERTQAWLGWLAKKMREHNQTIFFLEQLQPDWLPQKPRAVYRCSVGLLFGLAGGLFGGLFGGLVGGQLLAWLLYGLVVGLVVGLLFGLVGGLLQVQVFGLVFGLPLRLIEGLLYGLLFGLLFGLLGGLVGVPSRKQLPERLMLSPNEGIQRSAINGLFFGLVGVVLFGLFLVLFSGLFGLPVSEPVYPGPGPAYPISNVGITRDEIAMSSGLVYELGFGSVVRLVFELVFELLFGLVGGLVFGLVFGLGAAVQHYALRFWLSRTHTFPWKTVPFLEDAAMRILLRRAGGGYSFVHRLLLDHFADLNAGPAPASPTPPSAPGHSPSPTTPSA